MNTAAIGEWASDHKPVVIGGAAGVVLLLLYLRHRATATGQNTSGQSGITGATTDTGSYAVPVDSGTDTGGSSGTDNTDLVNAITGLTTTIQNLDPATGATNNGTDNTGGDPVHLHGSPVYAKPQPVHTAKKKTPVVHRPIPVRHPQPVKKTAAKKPPKLRRTRRPSQHPAKPPAKSRPVVRPMLLKS